MGIEKKYWLVLFFKTLYLSVQSGPGDAPFKTDRIVCVRVFSACVMFCVKLVLCRHVNDGGWLISRK